MECRRCEEREKSKIKFSQKGATILTREKWQDCLATKKIHLASEMIDLSKNRQMISPAVISCSGAKFTHPWTFVFWLSVNKMVKNFKVGWICV